MPLKDRFIELYNAVAPDAWQVNFREGAGATVYPEEDQWRKLSGDAKRDLNQVTQSRMQKMSHFLWEANLLANRLIELPVAFLLAEGVKLTCEDEDHQKLLDRFWSDPINDMDMKLPKKARELALFGEQIYPVFRNEISGAIRIGYVDPALLETVVMDPDNPEQPIGLVTVKDAKGRARRYRVIVNGEEDVFTPRTRTIRLSFDDGDAFYFKVNDLSAGTRGRSDLLAQVDWLDAYDQFLFGELDRYNFLRAHIWDVTLKNATKDEVEKRAREITAPRPGSVRVHNDSESWNEVTPDLKATDTSQGARLLRNHVLGGATMSETWFGGGGDVNRSTAEAMELPTIKIYTMRQQVLKYMLESIGRYVLFSVAMAKNETPDWGDAAWKVQAIFPELSEKDLSKQTTALTQIAAAAAILIAQKLLTRKSALGLIATVAKKLGLEIDADAELAGAEAEAAKADEADSFTSPPGADEPGAAAAMQEALDLIGAWSRDTNERYAGLEKIAGERAAAGAAQLGTDKFIEALGAAAAAQSANTDRLLEALGANVANVVKHEWELTLKHGKTRKTITLGDGRKFDMTEEDA